MTRFLITVKGLPTETESSLKKIWGALCGALSGSFPECGLRPGEVVVHFSQDMLPEFSDGKDIFVTVEHFGEKLFFTVTESIVESAAATLYRVLDRAYPDARIFIKFDNRHEHEVHWTAIGRA